MLPIYGLLVGLGLIPLSGGQMLSPRAVTLNALAVLTPADPGAGLFHTSPTSSAASGTVIGWLGQVKVAASIRSRPDAGSKAYCTVRPKQYLVVRPDANKRWDGVRLNNGTYAYMLASAVAELPFEVSLKASGPFKCADGETVASCAKTLEGTAYLRGSTDPKKGIGNAALIQRAFEMVGIKAPASADGQIESGKPIVRLEDLKAGDVLFFWRKTEGSKYETAIYVGGDECILSDPKAGKVHPMRLDRKALSKLIAARRYGMG